MKNIVVILTAVAIGFSADFQTQQSAPTQTEPVKMNEIYISAYRTAIEDGEIDASEQALLDNLRKTLNISAFEIAAIRESLRSETENFLDQSGRWPLVAQNMAWGAGLYGWAIPTVLEAKDFKWYVGTEMLSLGGTFYFTYQYTKNMNISHARAQMMRAGSLLAFRYGWGTNTMLELWPDEDTNSKAWVWMLMASVPAGIYGGDYLYNKWLPSNGQAWSLALWSEIGAYTAKQLHSMLESEPIEPDYFYDPDNDPYDAVYAKYEKDHLSWQKKHIIVELAAYPIGIYLGHKYFGEKQYSFGDALMLYQGRWVGWFYGVMLSDLLNADFEKPEGRFLRTGASITGTLLMDRFIAGRDYTFGQAMLSMLGTGSGAAFGVGIGAILEADDSETMDLLVGAGGTVGFLLTDSIQKIKKESQKTSLKAGDNNFSMVPSFQLSPANTSGRIGVKLIPSLAITYQF